MGLPACMLFPLLQGINDREINSLSCFVDGNKTGTTEHRHTTVQAVNAI